jgi:hypothetical protein
VVRVFFLDKSGVRRENLTNKKVMLMDEKRKKEREGKMKKNEIEKIRKIKKEKGNVEEREGKRKKVEQI